MLCRFRRPKIEVQSQFKTQKNVRVKTFKSEKIQNLERSFSTVLIAQQPKDHIFQPISPKN